MAFSTPRHPSRRRPDAGGGKGKLRAIAGKNHPIIDKNSLFHPYRTRPTERPGIEGGRCPVLPALSPGKGLAGDGGTVDAFPLQRLFFRLVDYLVKTTHPDTREPGLKLLLEKIIHQANWNYLTILGVTHGGKEDKRGKVEFVAEYYLDDEPCEMHEVSRFKRFKGAWKYLDGKT